jgi:hypothetical protein
MVKDQIKLNTSRKGYSIVIKSENQALEKIKKLRIVKKMKKITKNNLFIYQFFTSKYKIFFNCFHL